MGVGVGVGVGDGAGAAAGLTTGLVACALAASASGCVYEVGAASGTTMAAGSLWRRALGLRTAGAGAVVATLAATGASSKARSSCSGVCMQR